MGVDVSEAIKRCRAYVLSALAAEADKRSESENWIDNERTAVALAATAWGAAHGFARRVTVADVERIEGNAVGHVDYASKLALYLAEFVIDPAAWQLARAEGQA